MLKVHVSHEYSGMGDYWGGNGRHWDDDAGCLFAYYGAKTTLRDCVDQWIDDYLTGGDCDSFPFEVTSEDIRAAILNFFTDKGRADYESGALAECSIEYAKVNDITDDDDDLGESPVWVILVEIEENDE